MNASETPAAAERHIPVFIDGHEYASRVRRVTEADLRRLPRPPIPDGKELWLDIPDEQDRPLAEGETIELAPGMRFFSEPYEITIHIDRTRYTVTKKRMTGLELRAVPAPPVASDRDLWLDIIDKRDKKIADDDIVRLRDGMRFFTAPGRINPGAR
jgi:hypothetical protein